MIIAQFLIQNKLEIGWFFDKTFLIADISMELILEMPFLTLSNENTRFLERGDLTWKNYTITEALLTAKRIELINKKKFGKETLHENAKIFLI